MPKFIVERDLQGIGGSSPQDLAEIARKSCESMESIGTKIQWIQSFIANDRTYCMFIAPDKETIMEHAQKGGFPVTSIQEIKAIIDPVDRETIQKLQMT